MAIKITNGFEIKSRNAVDTRIVLTKVQMSNMNDKLMPDVYFAICKEDNQLYVYNKNNDIDPVLGRFRFANQDLLDAVNNLDDITVKKDEALTKDDIDEICK